MKQNLGFHEKWKTHFFFCMTSQLPFKLNAYTKTYSCNFQWCISNALGAINFFATPYLIILFYHISLFIYNSSVYSFFSRLLIIVVSAFTFAFYLAKVLSLHFLRNTTVNNTVSSITRNKYFLKSEQAVVMNTKTLSLKDMIVQRNRNPPNPHKHTQQFSLSSLLFSFAEITHFNLLLYCFLLIMPFLAPTPLSHTTFIHSHFSKNLP